MSDDVSDKCKYIGDSRINISKGTRSLYDEILSPVKIGPQGSEVQVFPTNNMTALLCTFIGIEKHVDEVSDDRMKLKDSELFTHCFQIGNIDTYNVLGLVLRANHPELSKKDEHKEDTIKKLEKYASQYCNFGIRWLAAWINENGGEFEWKKLYGDLQNKDFTLKVD